MKQNEIGTFILLFAATIEQIDHPKRLTANFSISSRL